MHKESKPDNINFKQVGLFQDLAPDELNNVKTLLKEKSFQKGEILFFEGKQCERIFFVRSGRVKIFRTSSSGREQILEILNPGDTCSCHPGQGAWSCSATAEALTPCIVWFFSRDNYAQLIRTNTKLMQSLNKIFARRICHFSSLIEQVSLNDVKKRLVKFMLDMLKEYHTSEENKDILSLPFTREEIAQRIGTSRETVARYLHQMKRDGLIDITSHQIVIRDRASLEQQLLS